MSTPEIREVSVLGLGAINFIHLVVALSLFSPSEQDIALTLLVLVVQGFRLISREMITNPGDLGPNPPPFLLLGDNSRKSPRQRASGYLN